MISATCKYVIVTDRWGREQAIVFPSAISHDSVVGKDAKPVAAGMWYRNDANKEATRGIVTLDLPSISLNLGPRPQDAAIIAHTIESTTEDLRAS
jgi:hypothetical protein